VFASADRTVLVRILRFARRHRARAAGFVVVILLQGLVSIVPPLLFRAVIDDALPSGPNSEGRPVLLAGLTCGAVLAAAASTALGFTARRLSAEISGGVVYDLRVAVFDHVQRLPLGYFARTQTGALTSRLNNDVLGAQGMLTETLSLVLTNAVIAVTTTAAMLRLEWRSTVFALAILPLFMVPAKRVGRRLQSVLRTQMNHEAAMTAMMTERFSVSGAMLVKLYGESDDEHADFAHHAGLVRSSWVKTAVYARTFLLVLGLVGAAATAAVYWIAGQRVLDGTVSKGTLVALAAMIPMLYGALIAVTNARVDLMSALVSFERVFEVLDTPNSIVDDENAFDLEVVRGDISYDNVWFSYPAEVTVRGLEFDADDASTVNRVSSPRATGAPALRGVQLTIEAGQTAALVGRSGAGKTTLASLLPRLYDVTSGAVRIDGVDVRQATQRSLRRAIGVVSQDPHLFHTSIASNLRYAKPDASDVEIERACRAAQIHHVIAGLPQGYNSVVGERGCELSGGERQRVAIARVLLKDPAIVILDEATSQLDSESEALVRRAMAKATLGRTSIVIAHRLSTIVHADVIFVIDDGQIIERGRHPALIAQGGLYSDLYRTLFESAV
jgi:ATP-binding cassette subfamily B protein